MSKVLAGMTISLDGFINDGNGSIDQLYSDFDDLKASPFFQEMTKNTGAVIMGRHVYEMADPFTWVNETYEFQVPLFILAHQAPANVPPGNGKISVTFVTDGVASAIAKAKAAAGDKMVQIIGGANTIQQCLNSGLCDELGLDVMPVMLGKGIRLLDNIDTDKISLERVEVEQTTKARTSLVYKVGKR